MLQQVEELHAIGAPALMALDRLQVTFAPMTNPLWQAQICANRSGILLALGRREDARAAIRDAQVQVNASDHPLLAPLLRDLQTEIDDESELHGR